MVQADGKPSDLTSNLLDQLAHTGNGVMGVDACQCIILWNQAAESLLGYRASAVLGKRCYEVMKAVGPGPHVCCEHCPRFEQARKLQWSHNQLMDAQSKTGHRVRLQVISFCLLTSEKKFSSLVHVFWSFKESLLPADRVAFPSAEEEAPSPLLFLSRQELNVLRCIAAGMDTKSAAAVLFISPTTVRNHVQNIFRRLGVHSRLEAALIATRHWGQSP
ncbi:MAG: hypothetical protein A3F68_04305 [Acidobacteria bacterium RIFCSPLOWO2_12_FULL_54_10]|nr:MAG: hypothetical protein A3F68_04305 [Acidobacteria bacterium RIFCSPLOWO2_12_FULL_54_10]